MALTVLLSGGFAMISLPVLADVPPTLNSGVSSSLSRNWSGYAAENGIFTSVSGSWQVPEVSASPTSRISADAAWVGIGGVATGDLIQTGTLAITDSLGQISYQAWYELYPAGMQSIDSLDIDPGDIISASVTEVAPDRWSIMIKDETGGRGYQTTVDYDSTKASAEWVQEMISAGRRFVPLDIFGSVKFTAGQAVKDGRSVNIKDADAKPITMVNRYGEVLAEPTVLNLAGDGFIVNQVKIPQAVAPPIVSRYKGAESVVGPTCGRGY